MSDNFNKLSQDVNIGQSQQRRSSSVSKKSKQQKCCYLFNIKQGFVIFGVFDIVLVFILLTLTVNNYIHKKEAPSLTIIILLILFIPKFIGFMVVLTVDTTGVSHMYRVLLRFNMVILMFMAPIYFLHQIRSEYIPVMCDETGGNFMDYFKEAPKHVASKIG